MNNVALFLFIFLLLGYILFSFLGRSMVEGMISTNPGVYPKNPFGFSDSSTNNKDRKIPNIPLKFYGVLGPNSADATARIELTNKENDYDKIHITTRDPITKNEFTNTFISSKKHDPNNLDITNVMFYDSRGTAAVVNLKPDNSYEIRVEGDSVGTTLILNDKPPSPSSSPSNNTKTSNNQYDNYNHFNKQSTPNIPVLFYGPDGTTARIDLTNEENGYDKIHTNIRNISKTFTSSKKHDPYNVDYDITKVPFKDTAGNSANVILGSDNSYSIKVIDSLGRTNLILNDTNNQLPFEEETKEIIGIFTPINSSFSSFSSSSSSSNDYYNKGNNFDNYVPEKELKLPSYDYSGSLPPGISKQMIPKGDEDLYILKTQIVPPVCPVCPACHSATTLSSSSAPGSGSASGSTQGSSSNPASGSAQGSSSNPAFGSGSGFGSSSSSFPSSGSSSSFMKNDEPLFGNKKISNYKNINSEYLPMPVLSSFSSFGM